MAYYQINDIKRDRLPYHTEGIWKFPAWAPEIQNTPLLNLKHTGLCAIIAASIVEPVRHFASHAKALNLVYELPKNSTQTSIFIKETFKTLQFWSGLRKKLVYSCIQHTLDAGFKISMFRYLYGGTWSPLIFADGNSIKPLFFSMLAGFASGMTNYPLAVARKAYYADTTWPEELRKGYRSPLHALVTIPFKEGPLYLFRGGLLHYIGNSLGFGWTLFTFVWLKDKFKWVYRYNEVSYSLCKFTFLSLGFLSSAMASQPFFTMREIMDSQSKERGGKVSFATTYEAFLYLKYSWHDQTGNLIHGYWKWMRQYGFILYISLWLADDMGLLDNFSVDAGMEVRNAALVSD